MSDVLNAAEVQAIRDDHPASRSIPLLARSHEQLRGERDAALDRESGTSDTLDADRQEIARLREFGEHYSGAAQDAWDRIEVLEKALRGIASLPEQSEGWHSLGLAVVIAREALAAGSASPGGAETT